MGERDLLLDDAKDSGNGKSVAAKARPTDRWGIGGERSPLGDWGISPEKPVPSSQAAAGPVGQMGPSLQPVRGGPKPGIETNRPLFQPPLKAGEIEGGIEARTRCRKRGEFILCFPWVPWATSDREVGGGGGCSEARAPKAQSGRKFFIRV